MEDTPVLVALLAILCFLTGLVWWINWIINHVRIV